MKERWSFKVFIVFTVRRALWPSSGLDVGSKELRTWEIWNMDAWRDLEASEIGDVSHLSTCHPRCVFKTKCKLGLILHLSPKSDIFSWTESFHLVDNLDKIGLIYSTYQKTNFPVLAPWSTLPPSHSVLVLIWFYMMSTTSLLALYLPQSPYLAHFSKNFEKMHPFLNKPYEATYSIQFMGFLLHAISPIQSTENPAARWITVSLHPRSHSVHSIPVPYYAVTIHTSTRGFRFKALDTCLVSCSYLRCRASYFCVVLCTNQHWSLIFQVHPSISVLWPVFPGPPWSADAP